MPPPQGTPKKASRCPEWFHIMDADTVTALHVEFCEGAGESSSAAMEFTEARARDGFVRLARNDFDARVDFPARSRMVGR